MSEEPLSLVTLEEVKSSMNITDTNADEELGRLVKEMSREFSDAIDRDLEKKTHTQYFDGDVMTKKLFVNNYPIVSITSIKDDLDRTFGADSAIDTDEYSFYEDEGIIVLDTVLTPGQKNIQVVYVGGYDEIPSDAKNCVKMMVAREYLLNFTNLNSKESSQVLEARLARLDKRIKEIVDRYRRFKVG